MEIAVLVAFLLIGIIVPLLDRLTDSPVMRRQVNAGTDRWRTRERLRKKEDIGFSANSLDDHDADERRFQARQMR